jgi:hypothetical protein
MKHTHNTLSKLLFDVVRISTILLTLLVIWIFVRPNTATGTEQFPQDTTQLSTVCFGIAGLVAIMPWQLASLKDDKSALIRSGNNMSLGALLFLSATILKYTKLNSTHLLSFLGIKVDGIIDFLSIIAFTFAAAHTGRGFNQFAEYLLCDMYCQGNTTPKPSETSDKNTDLNES